MIVADTGGILALLSRRDVHHAAVRAFLERERRPWIVPWAVLPEVDYLATTRLGPHAASAFLSDVARGVFVVGDEVSLDLARAMVLQERYRDLALGLVDSVVMAEAERLRAQAIVTIDARHFRAVRLEIDPPPRLVPLDPS